MNMSFLTYTFNRDLLLEESPSTFKLNNNYLSSFKANVESQLAKFLKQIVHDKAEIELTLSPDGTEILYWKVAKWNAEGYDRLITSNVI